MAQEHRLHISNFPFFFTRKDTVWALGETYLRPSPGTPLRSGPDVPHRRHSAFVHWMVPDSEMGPQPEDITGWLPQYMESVGWNVPLKATWVRPPPIAVS